MSLQDVISDLVLDFIGQEQISHGCVGIIELFHKFILTLSGCDQEIEVDTK